MCGGSHGSVAKLLGRPNKISYGVSPVVGSGVSWIMRNARGNASTQFIPFPTKSALRVSFNMRPPTSARPFAWWWYACEKACLMPSRAQVVANHWYTNCDPLSEVTIEGNPISPHDVSMSKCAAFSPVSPSSRVGLAIIQPLWRSTQSKNASYCWFCQVTSGR